MPSLDSTLGVLQLGGFLSTLLFGIITLQTYDYFQEYPKDGLPLKSMVLSSWVLELGHIALVWHSLYCIAVTYYGEPAHITNPPQTLYLTLVLSVLVTTITGAFFAQRIHILSQRRLVPIFCYILIVLHLISSFGMVVALCTGAHTGGVYVLQIQYRWLMIVSLILQAVMDVLMTAALCYWLARIRSGALRRTRRIADSLITWAIESTIVKSGVCILELILFLTRDDLAWGLPYLIQSALHLNSMLVSLNGRNRITSSAGSEGGYFDVNTPNLGGSTTQGNRAHNIAIQMSRVTEIHVEAGQQADTKISDIEFGVRSDHSKEIQEQAL